MEWNSFLIKFNDFYEFFFCIWGNLFKTNKIRFLAVDIVIYIF